MQYGVWSALSTTILVGDALVEATVNAVKKPRGGSRPASFGDEPQQRALCCRGLADRGGVPAARGMRSKLSVESVLRFTSGRPMRVDHCHFQIMTSGSTVFGAFSCKCERFLFLLPSRWPLLSPWFACALLAAAGGETEEASAGGML